MSIKRLLFNLYLTSVCVPMSAQVDVVINEVMVGNIDQFMDPSYNYGGWIELYNPSDTTFNISKIYISDDPDNLKKFQMPSLSGVVRSGKYRNIWFDHYSTGNEYSSNSNKQVPFKLNVDGGTIYISDPNGNLLIEQSYPPSIPRVSWARKTDGGNEWGYCSAPTSANSNNGSPFATERLSPPVVDRDGTVFSQPFDFQVIIPEGATLRYTTDGSTPTLKKGSTSETGRFRLTNQSRVFRFRLFQDGYLPSAVVTRSFIYRSKGYYLPIVSVVTEQGNLYNDTYGAYTDGTNGIDGNNKKSSNKNRSWERPVNFEYLLPDTMKEYRVVALNQEVDFEVNGGWSRHFFPASSFKLKSDAKYEGANFMNFPIFTAKPYLKSKAITVRNGGNDNYCRIMDAGIHEIIRTSGFYLDTQAWQPAHVFINGEYKFMFNVRETNNKNFAYSNYGIDKDAMDQFEINSVDGYAQRVGDDVVFQQWRNLATELGKDPQNESIYQQICKIVDIDEYCNYMAAECYVGCNDWLTNSNNVKGFRSREDGKFHLVFMDLDQGFTMNNMISSLPSHRNDSRYYGGRNFLIDIFLNMLSHEPFKRKFIDAFCIVAGSVFAPDRSQSIITQMATAIEPALGFDGYSPWNSANSLIQKITNENSRSSRMNSFRNYFGLDYGYNVRLSTNIPQAELLLGGQRIPTGKLEGELLGNDVKLTTYAPSGYRFKGWKIDGGATLKTTLVGMNDTWSYYDKGSLDGRLWMNPTYLALSWATGATPMGYGNIRGTSGQNDIQTTLNYGDDSQNKRPTYYFRHQFKLDKIPEEGESLQLTFHVDDGCIIYLNGTEIKRYNFPDGNITYNDFTITYVGNQAYSETIVVDKSLLKVGTNTLAAEVHNNSATSSDIYWAAELILSEFAPYIKEDVLNLSQIQPSELYQIEACYEPLPDDSIVANLVESPYAPIRVNEISSANTVYANDYGKRNDWIELYNATDMPLDIAGLYVSDNPAKPQKYQIPASGIKNVNTIIPPHGYLIVWADKLEPNTGRLIGESKEEAEDYATLLKTVPYQQYWLNITNLHVPFKLSNDSQQQVMISSSEEFVGNNSQYFDLHPAMKSFTDRLVYEPQQGNQTVGRYPDGGNSLYLMNRITIAQNNILHSDDQFLGYDKGQVPANPELAIESVQVDDTSDFATSQVEGIYNLNGLRVANTVRELQTNSFSTGIYIVKYTNGKSRKIRK